MADLDQISHMIGRIEANTTNLRSWLDQHEERDQERFEKLAQRIDASNGVLARIDKIEELAARQAELIALHEPIIENVRRFKWIAASIAAGVIALAGVAGSVGSFAKDWLIK